MKHISQGGAMTKLTEETKKIILSAINRHAPRGVAAMSAGIAQSTFFNWIKRGKKDREDGIESEFANFVIALEELEAEKIMQRLDYLLTGEKGWQAHLAILERCWRKYFGPDAGMEELIKKYEELAKKVSAIHEAKS